MAGLEEVGIFRLPGRSTRVKDLKIAYDMGETPDLKAESEV